MNLNNRMLNIDKKTIKKNKKRKKQIKNRFFYKKPFFIEIKDQKIKNVFLYNTICVRLYPEKINHPNFVNISPTVVVIDTLIERSSQALQNGNPKIFFSKKVSIKF